MDREQTCAHFAEIARRASTASRLTPLRFLVGAAMAGGFVAAASILSLSVGAHLAPGPRPLLMGAVFGLSIILVLFGGAELFNGQIMFTSFAVLRRRMTPIAATRLLGVVWLGNVAGALLVAALFALGGGGQVFGASSLLNDMVHAKLHASIGALLARGALCNWLACMGIWTAARLKGEAAKMVVLAWCVMAYVACGFEHSIADTTVLGLGLLAPVPVGALGSAIVAVAVVSAGNLLGGGLMVAGAYAVYARAESDPEAAAAVTLDVGQAANAVPRLQAEVARRFGIPDAA